MFPPRELFGDENGLIPAPNAHPSNSRVFGFLTKAKAQVTKRRMEEAAANERGMYFAAFLD